VESFARKERKGFGREARVDARWWRNARGAAGRSARREVRVDAPHALQQRRPGALRQRDLLHGRDARRPGARGEVARGEVRVRNDGAVVAE
jgi:hypothetical protein